jgi:hypothetical protein
MKIWALLQIRKGLLGVRKLYLPLVWWGILPKDWVDWLDRRVLHKVRVMDSKYGEKMFKRLFNP